MNLIHYRSHPSILKLNIITQSILRMLLSEQSTSITSKPRPLQNRQKQLKHISIKKVRNFTNKNLRVSAPVLSSDLEVSTLRFLLICGYPHLHTLLICRYLHLLSLLMCGYPHLHRPLIRGYPLLHCLLIHGDLLLHRLLIHGYLLLHRLLIHGDLLLHRLLI